MSQSGASHQFDSESYRTIVEKLQALDNHRQDTVREMNALRREVRQILVFQATISEKISVLVGNGTTDLQPIVPKLIKDVADLKEFRLLSEPMLETYPDTKGKIESIYTGAKVISIISAVISAIGAAILGVMKFLRG